MVSGIFPHFLRCINQPFIRKKVNSIKKLAELCKIFHKIFQEDPPSISFSNVITDVNPASEFHSSNHNVRSIFQAAKLAIERGWAINLGGGFHHCSSSRGGGFCAYADISLGIKFLLEMKLIERAMIVDLDAHQGNGHARDFINMRDQVYILDVYNRSIYPHDGYAKRKSNECPVKSSIPAVYLSVE